jgi:hypothetical protein
MAYKLALALLAFVLPTVTLPPNTRGGFREITFYEDMRKKTGCLMNQNDVYWDPKDPSTMIMFGWMLVPKPVFCGTCLTFRAGDVVL